MANTKLSAKRGLKMDTHIRRLLIIMVCWFIFMGIMKGRKFYSVVNFQTMFAQFPEFGLMSLGVMVCMISSGIDLSTVGVANMTSITMALRQAEDPANPCYARHGRTVFRHRHCLDWRQCHQRFPSNLCLSYQ